jgi:subtilisin family serine protease
MMKLTHTSCIIYLLAVSCLLFASCTTPPETAEAPPPVNTASPPGKKIEGSYIVVLKGVHPLAEDTVRNGRDSARSKKKDEVKKLAKAKWNFEIHDDSIFVDSEVGFIKAMSPQTADDVENDHQDVEAVFQDVELQIGDPIQQRDPIQQDAGGNLDYASSDLVGNATAAVDAVGGSQDGSTKSTRVWVFDTGIDEHHSLLNLASADSRTLSQSYIAGFTPFTDEHGHGTHVAGLIGARSAPPGSTGGPRVAIGVSEGAKLISIKILNSEGLGRWSYLRLGLDHVLAKGTAGDVVNLSLGRYCVGNCNASDPHIRNSIRALHNAGIYVVMSAGNEAGEAKENYPGCIEDPPPPTDVATVYTIASITQAKQCAFYTNLGDPVRLVAIGTNVLSTYPRSTATGPDRFCRMSGTSMSAAIVSGIIHARGGAPLDGVDVPCKSEMYKLARRVP